MLRATQLVLIPWKRAKCSQILRENDPNALEGMAHVACGEAMSIVSANRGRGPAGGRAPLRGLCPETTPRLVGRPPSGQQRIQSGIIAFERMSRLPAGSSLPAGCELEGSLAGQREESRSLPMAAAQFQSFPFPSTETAAGALSRKEK